MDSNAKAQIQQSLNLTFSVSTEMNPFQDTLFCYGLSVSGSVELYSENSLARVLLVDMDGKEHLVLEYYPLLIASITKHFIFESKRRNSPLRKDGCLCFKDRIGRCSNFYFGFRNRHADQKWHRTLT